MSQLRAIQPPEVPHPERRLAVAILSSGKPILSLHAIRMVQVLAEIGRTFPKVDATRPGVMRSEPYHGHTRAVG